MSETHPRVSVVIPTYHHGSLINQTLCSLFEQSFKNFEVIVVNDGSPDETEEVLSPWVSSGKIRYFSQANAGQAMARNRGLAEARGEYVAFLDDDDLWPADSLSVRVEAIQGSEQLVMVYGYTEFIGDQGERFPRSGGPFGETQADFLIQNWMWSPGQALFRTDAVRRIDGFDAAIWGADDWDLSIRLASIGRALFVDYCTLRYRRHADNASKNVLKMYRNICRVRHRHLGRFPRPCSWRIWWRSRSAWARSFAPKLVQYGSESWDAGRYSIAAKSWCAATVASPMHVLRQSPVARQCREYRRRWHRSVPDSGRVS